MSARTTPARSALVLLLSFALGLAAPAALAAPPEKDASCATLDVYSRLACRQAAISKQIDYTSDTAFGDGTAVRARTSPAKLKHLRDAKDGAARAKKHTREDFKRHAKAAVLARKDGGHLIPFDAKDDVAGGGPDGVCDYEQGDARAECAAVELDASGNLQRCNPAKKLKGKGKNQADGLECDRAFDPGDAETEAEMADVAKDMDDVYDTTEDTLIDMNKHLDVVNESSSPPVRGLAAAAPADACALPPSLPGLSEAVFGLHVVQVVLAGISSGADSLTAQTAMGWNARGAAFALNVIASVANVAYTIAAEIDRYESGKTQAQIMACVRSTSGSVADLAKAIADLQAVMVSEHAGIRLNDNQNTGTILGEVQAARQEAYDLLITPQGQRAGFPLK